MPTYEYSCNDCKHEFEEFRKISERDTAVCPKCQSTKVSQQLSATNVIATGCPGHLMKDDKNFIKNAAARTDERQGKGWI